MKLETLDCFMPSHKKQLSGKIVVRIAALFVETGGCYFEVPGIDLWDEARDARNYQGPHPVIAHPPCQLWGNMAAINYKRWGGEHNKPGNDGGCFASAIQSIKKYGGVLEHPAKTRAWEAFGIGSPKPCRWVQYGSYWVAEVWQSTYGHRANKATWLMYVGEKKPFDLNWERRIGSYQIGFSDQRGKNKNKPTLSKREANATPPAFRDELIRLVMAKKSIFLSQEIP